MSIDDPAIKIERAGSSHMCTICLGEDFNKKITFKYHGLQSSTSVTLCIKHRKELLRLLQKED